jgi:hypothetical protein
MHLELRRQLARRLPAPDRFQNHLRFKLPSVLFSRRCHNSLLVNDETEAST